MLQYKANRNLYNNANATPTTKQTGIYTTMQMMQYKASRNSYKYVKATRQRKAKRAKHARGFYLTVVGNNRFWTQAEQYRWELDTLIQWGGGTRRYSGKTPIQWGSGTRRYSGAVGHADTVGQWDTPIQWGTPIQWDTPIQWGTPIQIPACHFALL